MQIHRLRIAAVVAASASGLGSAHAVTQPVTYVGAGFLTAVTSSCTTIGFSQNQGLTVVYRPAANGLNDGLELQFQLGSVLLTPTTASLNGRRAFNSVGISDKAVSYSSHGTSNLKVRVAADGLSATIAGTIQNPYGDSSCTLTLQAAATLRP